MPIPFNYYLLRSKHSQFLSFSFKRFTVFSGLPEYPTMNLFLSPFERFSDQNWRQYSSWDLTNTDKTASITCHDLETVLLLMQS